MVCLVGTTWGPIYPKQRETGSAIEQRQKCLLSRATREVVCCGSFRLVAAHFAILVTIYHFNRFPLYSIAANALAVPITGFWIMPWALVACVLMPFGAEGLALVPMGWGIDLVAAIARGVTSWPGAVLTVPSMPAAGLILLALGIRPYRRRGHGRRIRHLMESDHKFVWQHIAGLSPCLD